MATHESTTSAERVSALVRLLIVPVLLMSAFGSHVVHAGVSSAAPASAAFRGVDTATLGNWVGTYGSQGYDIANDAVSYPPYAQVVVSGGTPYTWEVPTTDARGLQHAAAADRVATCWYSDTSFTIDVNLTDGAPHQIALYAVDFSAYARSERIDVLDAANGAVLDSRAVAAFQGGQYLVWTVAGHVTLRVTSTGPINAVVSGLFLDPAPSPGTIVTMTSPGPDRTYGAPGTIPLAVTASTLQGQSIARVDFLSGTTVIGSARSTPYTLSWNNVPAGTYLLSARAIDSNGATAAAWPVSVTVVAGLPAVAATAPLVRSADFVYRGAFRLPQGQIGGSTFSYGGTALAFNAERGSLFVVGQDWQQQVAEIGVPEIRTGGLADLDIASVLQPFTDVTEGRMRSVSNANDTVKVGGLLPYHGKLYLSAYVYYDANGQQQLSHFVSGTDLSVQGDVTGPYQVGAMGAGFVSGAFGLVPAAWQSALGGPVLNGQCCLSIISRTSYGPSVFAIDPAQLGAANPLPAAPLVYYTGTHQLGQYGAQSTLFNGSTQMGGVVFPEDTRSVLFFGKQGLGPACYGEGTSDPSLVGTGPAGDPYCYDPANSAKGEHSYPYAPYVWAYDAIDLVAVRSGLRQPWEVKPYAAWSLDLPFAGSSRILGAAYDSHTGRMFLSLEYGDGTNPLIHVFTLGSIASAPAAPPTVSLVSPANGAAFAPLTPITLTATAGDSDGTVSTVAFYANGALVGASSGSPFSVEWTGAAAGTYQVTAVATDNSGLTATSSTVPIVIRQPIAPSVSLVSPANGATFAPLTPVTLTATASDSDGTVSTVAFYVNGVLVGASSGGPYRADWAGAAPGTYQVTAIATDNSGATSTSTITISIVASGQTLLTMQVPAAVVTGSPRELGTRVIGDVSGQITAIRFWKSAGETGVHTGHIWSAAGKLLTSVAFVNETASGWQQQALSAPLSVLANTEYLVSVNTGPTGLSVATADALATGLVNMHLRAPAWAGRRGMSGMFPAIGSSDNYFRDVVFLPDASGEDAIAPTVAIVQPTAGSKLSGTVTIAATAADNVGVTGVQFQVDGVNLAAEVTVPPYRLTWNSANVMNGTHTLTAIARDAAGHVTTASENVKVASPNSSQTLLTTQVPATASASYGAVKELGTRVVSDVSGQITAIRFWKSASENGPHTGHIWSAGGQMLAEVAFASETDAGWQQASLPAPVAVLANVEYVVSVNTAPNAYFVVTGNMLALGVANGDLRAPAGFSGRIGGTGTFPWLTTLHNFFRDVVFVPDAVEPMPSI